MLRDFDLTSLKREVFQFQIVDNYHKIELIIIVITETIIVKILVETQSW